MLTKLLLRTAIHLISSPSLWCRLLAPIAFLIILSIIGTILLLALALVPQQKALANLNLESTWAWIIAILLVLCEIALFILILSFLLIQKASDRVFDLTLSNRGVTLDTPSASSASFVNKDSITDLIVFALSLPINAIPILGTVLFVALNGYTSGHHIHSRYPSRLQRGTFQKRIGRRRRSRNTSKGIEKNISCWAAPKFCLNLFQS